MEQERSRLLASLFKDNHERLFRLAFRLTGCEDLAEESVQETFLLALVQKKDFTTHPNPEGWFTLVVGYLCKNERRLLRSHSEVPLESVFHLAAPETTDDLLELLPEELPDPDKQILILRFGKQMDHRMIADYLGLSESASRSRFSRALERCRDLVIEHNAF